MTIGALQHFPWTPTADTSIFASGDVIADTEIIPGQVFRAAKGVSMLRSLTVLDKDDQGTAIDVVLLSRLVSLGTENAAISITDANAEAILGVVSVAAADFTDLINSRVATKSDINLALAADPGSNSAELYAALVCRSGTPTYTASGLIVSFGIERG